MLRLPALLLACVIGAQQTSPVVTGTLAGTVTDPGGFVIPGARVVALLGSDQRTTSTSSTGQYRIEGLAAGKWSVSVSLAGFATARAQVPIAAGQNAVWNATVVIRSGHSSLSPAGPDPTDSRLSSGVYDAVLRHIYRGNVPANPAIAQVSLVQPFDELDWPSRLSAVPLSLQQSSSSPEARRPVTLRAESFPAGTRFLTTPSIDSIPYSSFSRAFVTADGRGALVVYEHICGTLCAESTVAWLQRNSASAPWTIRATHTFMIS